MERVQELTKWIEERSSREKVFLFIMGFVVIYFIWDIIMERPLSKKDAAVKIQINKVQNEIKLLTDQINTINNVVKQISYTEMLEEKNLISSKSADIQQKLSKIKPNVMPMASYSNFIKDMMLAQQDVNLIGIKKSPPEPWISKDLAEADLPDYFNQISKYTITIEIQSNYFNTLAYLQRLEKLPWQIYWDSLEYKVQTYPEARAVLQLHVLIDAKSAV